MKRIATSRRRSNKRSTSRTVAKRGATSRTRPRATLAAFISANAKAIIAEWTHFARRFVPSSTLAERRDHVAGMLAALSIDMGTSQTAPERDRKAKGRSDSAPEADNAANSHGTDRAATGYTPSQMVAEFRALRASILRLWSETQTEFDGASVAEITRFNEAIDQMLAESLSKYAQDVDRAKDLFLGVLGHDLRNPLGAIMMSATVMIRQEGADGPHAQTAARILRSGTRMNAMIGALLDFTRGRLGGGIPVTRASVDLEAVCRQAVDEITSFHPDRTVELAAKGDLRGEWDGARIAQVVSNLVGNAIQHGEEKRPVGVVAHGTSAEVVISVHNEGPRIPKDKLAKIFSPFRRLAAKREHGKGTSSLGLGLYIAQAIVVAHDGTIEVRSTKKGTTFTVRLPRGAATQ